MKILGVLLVLTDPAWSGRGRRLSNYVKGVLYYKPNLMAHVASRSVISAFFVSIAIPCERYNDHFSSVKIIILYNLNLGFGFNNSEG